MRRKSRNLDRRDFLKTTSAIAIGAMASSHRIAPLLAGGSPNEKVVVAVIGVNVCWPGILSRKFTCEPKLWILVVFLGGGGEFCRNRRWVTLER